MKKIMAIVTLGMLAGMCLGAEAFEPKDMTIPQSIKGVLDWLSSTWAVQLGASAAIVISLVQLLKVMAPIIGGKLTGKAAFVLTAGVSLLVALENVIQDGAITGSDWTAVIVGVAVLAASAFGYRLLFSDSAKAALKE